MTKKSSKPTEAPTPRRAPIDISVGPEGPHAGPEWREREEKAMADLIENASAKSAATPRPVDAKALAYFRGQLLDVSAALASTRTGNGGRELTKAELTRVVNKSIGSLEGLDTKTREKVLDAAAEMVNEFDRSGNLAAAAELGRHRAITIAGDAPEDFEPPAVDDDGPNMAEVLAKIPRA